MPASLSTTLIVMPAYNEEEAVGQVVREVLDTLPGIACLVVSDGSKDRTVEVAQAAGARVLELPFNLGVGGAMRAGFRYAQRHGFDNVIQIDSDGQHNPESVPQLLAALERKDVVIGARFAGEGDYEVSGPRKWAMRFLSFTLSRIDGRRSPTRHPATADPAPAPSRCSRRTTPPSTSATRSSPLSSRPATASPSSRCPCRCGPAPAASRRTTRRRPPSTWRAPAWRS